MRAAEFESWSKTEKTAARRAFDLALGREFARIRAKAQEMLADSGDPPDTRARRGADLTGPRVIWKVREYLNERAKFVDRVYDCRYSVLGEIFALLVGKGVLALAELEALRPEKIARIGKMSELFTDKDGEPDAEESDEPEEPEEPEEPDAPEDDGD